jgi:phosphoribosyl 1,2-cyclic phosphate phosphodiesterase
MSLTFTILGCSSSTGVPRVALGWGACDPNNPKNRRRRCSLLVERHNEAGEHTAALVDTSPDLREQLLGAEVDWLDAVLFTHAHADHTHGIDDLRLLALSTSMPTRRRPANCARGSAIASRRRPAANIRRS